jgi:hypothetical protein
MECCGEERKTPFCPQCGKKIVDANGLQGLLLHVQQRVRSLKRTPSDPKKLDKWQSWERLLKEVVEPVQCDDTEVLPDTLP